MFLVGSWCVFIFLSYLIKSTREWRGTCFGLNAKKISLLLIKGPARKSVELNCLKLWGSWGYFLCKSIVFTRKITITSVWEGALSLGKQGKHLCRNIRVLSNFHGTFGVCSVLTMNTEICPWAWSSPPLVGLNWFLRHLLGSTVWESLLVWATATPTYHPVLKQTGLQILCHAPLDQMCVCVSLFWHFP